MTCTMVVAAPLMCVGGVIMALRQDLGLSWLLLVIVPLLVAVLGVIVSRMRPLFRLMQVRLDGINGSARPDRRYPGYPCIRSRTRETRALRQRQPRADADVAAGGPAVGADVSDGDAGGQRCPASR